MLGEREQHALRRIEAALARIEGAAARPVAASAPFGDSALRAQVVDALRDLDELIGAIEA